jgi:hypothetical protein
MTLVETDTKYRVHFFVYECRCGKRAVTTDTYNVGPPKCDCASERQRNR